MNDIITKIIVALVSSIATAGILSIPKLLKIIKSDNNHPIIKRQKMIFATVRYVGIIALSSLLFVYIDLSKLFILFLAILLIVLSCCITVDIIYFSLVRLANISVKERLLDEKEQILNKISEKNTSPESIKKYTERLREIDAIIENRSYKNC